MTIDQNSTHTGSDATALSLPFLANSAELLRVRVTPAQLSRVLGVSKQSVSRWIAAGKVTISPLDGKADLQEATRQVLRNTNPGKLRSRVLRRAVDDVQELRESAALADERVAAVQTQLDAANKRIAALEEFSDRYGRCEDILAAMVVEAAPKLRREMTRLRSTAWERAGAAASTTSTGETPDDWAAAVAEAEAVAADAAASPDEAVG